MTSDDIKPKDLQSGIPDDFVFPELPPPLIIDNRLGHMHDRLAMQLYAMKCMTLLCSMQNNQNQKQEQNLKSKSGGMLG